MFKGRFIDTITYVDIERYRQEKSKTHSPLSVNRHQTVFVTLFNKLKEWRRFKIIDNVLLPDENPAALVKKVNERPFARKRVLSSAEFQRLIDSATMEVRRICLAAVHTTLRLKDLKNLAWANVNEATNQLEGVQAKTSRPYSVPINSVMRKLLLETPKSRKHIFDFENFRKEFDKARAKADLKEFQFRDLRRTGARFMLQQGVDLATVSSYLGHASLAMTERYVPPSQEDKQRGGEVLSKFSSDGFK